MRRNLLLVAVAAWMLAACTTTKVVTVEKVRTDTVLRHSTKLDSVFVHDSIRISEKGDTVRIEKWHTRYIEKVVADTVYRSKTDSVPVPYPVEKLVEKKLNWWQKTQMYAGDALMVLLMGLIVYGLFRLRCKLWPF